MRRDASMAAMMNVLGLADRGDARCTSFSRFKIVDRFQNEHIYLQFDEILPIFTNCIEVTLKYVGFRHAHRCFLVPGNVYAEPMSRRCLGVALTQRKMLARSKFLPKIFRISRKIDKNIASNVDYEVFLKTK